MVPYLYRCYVHPLFILEMDYIKEHIEDPSLLSGDDTRSSSSDEEDFFLLFSTI